MATTNITMRIDEMFEEVLADEGCTLDSKYKDHALSGNWAGGNLWMKKKL